MLVGRLESALDTPRRDACDHSAVHDDFFSNSKVVSDKKSSSRETAEPSPFAEKKKTKYCGTVSRLT